MTPLSAEIASLIFNASGDCLWLIDSAGRPIYSNYAHERLLGYSTEDELDFGPASPIVHPDDRERLGALYHRAVTDGAAWKGEVFRWRAKDGAYRWWESDGTPLFDAAGELTGFCGADRDITERLEQENRLRESERRFRETFERAGVGIAHLSIDGRWLRVNTQLSAMLGYTEDELLAHDFRELAHPDDAAAATESLRRLVAGEIPSYTIEKRFRRKDGSFLWVSATSSIVYDAEGRPEYRISIMRDISDRKNAEEALRRSEEDYRTLFENSNDAILVIDPIDGTIVAANHEASSMYGQPLGSLIGASIGQLSDDPEKGRNHARQLSESVPKVAFTTTHIGADGAAIELEITLTRTMYGGRVMNLATNHDVTQHNRLLRELEQSELRFRSIVEHAYDLIFIMDPSGTGKFISGSARQNLGYSPEELQGTDLVELLDPDVRENIYRVLKMAAEETNRKRATQTARVRCKDGSWRWFEATSVNMIGAPGVDGLVVIAHDVTEQIELAERLEQARRIESLGQVAATVAHEINNALMVVQPASELLLRKYGSDPGVTRLARQILSGVQRGKRVTQQILRFARPAEPSRTEIVLCNWLASLEPELRSLVEPKATLNVTCSDRSLATVADADQLHQVMTNLVMNARDAMQEGSTLHIAIAPAGAGMIEISVRDDGRGIPEDILPRLFEPLFTTKAKGTGIGLPLCRQIVEAHGGTIEVASTEGKGTVVTLRLRGTTGTASARGSVLIVDDDELVSEALQGMLEDAGYATERLHGAAGVAEKVRAARPNLVLLDVQLGDDDGRDVFAELRRNRFDVPVVLMSGHVQIAPEDLDARSSFLAKPFEIDELLRAVAAFEE
jgi:two-component system, cell cycle sensor histidine kinase and response regulator CckA